MSRHCRLSLYLKGPTDHLPFKEHSHLVLHQDLFPFLNVYSLVLLLGFVKLGSYTCFRTYVLLYLVWYLYLVSCQVKTIVCRTGTFGREGFLQLNMRHFLFFGDSSVFLGFATLVLIRSLQTLCNFL